MDEFIIQWYSRTNFNFQPSEIKQLFRKIETKSNQLITNNLHQEFNKNILVYWMYIATINKWYIIFKDQNVFKYFKVNF